MPSIFVLMSNLSGGGAQRVMATAYNLFPEEIDAQMVILEDTNVRYPIKGDVISLHFYRYKHIPQIIYSLWKIPIGIIKYTLLLKKYRPKISFSILSVENIINICACYITGVKPIISIRGNPFNQYQKFADKVLFRLVLYLSKRYKIPIITNSYDVASEIKMHYNLDNNILQVIPNPKDIGQILEMKTQIVTESFFKTDDPIIITVGRLTELKGQWHLIRVFEKLRKIIPCKLVICGAGELEDRLKNLVSELNLNNEVLFLGWCDNPYKYINKSTIFVYPSLSDGLPNALIEALIVGCPSISSDCKYGPREIFANEKYGLLSMELDASSFSSTEPLTIAETDLMNKIVLLLKDKKLQKSFTERSKEIREIYDMQNTVSKYTDVFSEVQKLR